MFEPQAQVRFENLPRELDEDRVGQSLAVGAFRRRDDRRQRRMQGRFEQAV